MYAKFLFRTFEMIKKMPERKKTATTTFEIETQKIFLNYNCMNMEK